MPALMYNTNPPRAQAVGRNSFYHRVPQYDQTCAQNRDPWSTVWDLAICDKCNRTRVIGNSPSREFVSSCHGCGDSKIFTPADFDAHFQKVHGPVAPPHHTDPDPPMNIWRVSSFADHAGELTKICEQIVVVTAFIKFKLLDPHGLSFLVRSLYPSCPRCNVITVPFCRPLIESGENGKIERIRIGSECPLCRCDFFPVLVPILNSNELWPDASVGNPYGCVGNHSYPRGGDKVTVFDELAREHRTVGRVIAWPNPMVGSVSIVGENSNLNPIHNDFWERSGKKGTSETAILREVAMEYLNEFGEPHRSNQKVVPYRGGFVLVEQQSEVVIQGQVRIYTLGKWEEVNGPLGVTRARVIQRPLVDPTPFVRFQ